LVAKALHDHEFRKRLLANPTEVYAESLGHKIPDGVEIRVVEETPTIFYLVLPFLPSIDGTTRTTILAVAERELTHREPCWGLGDGLE
jgi:hypothetical protein